VIAPANLEKARAFVNNIVSVVQDALPGGVRRRVEMVGRQGPFSHPDRWDKVTLETENEWALEFVPFEILGHKE
jgi:hypothetical protein